MEKAGIGFTRQILPARHSVECSLFHKRRPSSSFIVEVEYAFSAKVDRSVFVVGIEIIKLETSSLLWCQAKLFEVFKRSACEHGCAIRQHPTEIYIHGAFHIVMLAGI